ncbi:unnamed protein product [Rotaria magnacalcarata]|uniref:Uncharacterized protein n=1 Tax=Rotaria magnacalcarata TaxID=392030 RepID=A0A820PYN2_9BILA|nr:unnamed protein product [Rotaria magnacalcarata]CAF4412657.1 unnamed protein product [Rotaria magnacalcarata]
MTCFDFIDSKFNLCSDQEYSPLCFCRSSFPHFILTDLFLAKIFLYQCDNSFSTHQYYQSEFLPPSFALTQIIPKLPNLSHCFDDIHCIYTLNSLQHCQRCQLTPSLLLYNNFSTDRCFYVCQHDASCGFLCLNQHVTVSINCHA